MTRADERVQEPLDPGAGLAEGRVELPDGRRIRVVTAGERPGPLVVFEAGMTAPAAEWIAVQRAVSARARTLAYDRSGYAGSDDDAQARTIDRMADDLHDLLDAVGEAEPVVLVAHSWGGAIVRLFARRHPERVAGIVLVDATPSLALDRGQARLGILSFRITSLLLRVGALPLVKRMVLPHGASAQLSDDDMTIMWRDYATVRAMRTGVREAKQFTPAHPQLIALEREGTPDVPTVALQGGRVEGGKAAREFRVDFNAVTKRLMDAHPQGRMIVVDGAGHLIPQEKPEAVVQAILDVLASTTP
jgi:pimeloyl-ACP methyl ester carboxylesterase